MFTRHVFLELLIYDTMTGIFALSPGDWTWHAKIKCQNVV